MCIAPHRPSAPRLAAADTNTFASASLDRTIKVWSLGQPTANMTLEGHEKGVNCVDYYQGGERRKERE